MSKVLHEVRERTQLLVEIRQGIPGPAGQPGAPGGSGLQHAAGVALGGHRIVQVRPDGKLDYASNLDAAHADRVVGMTVASAEAGTDATILQNGAITEPSWSWEVDLPVFLGDNGMLTQTPPVAPAAFVLRVGMPMSATSLFINIGNPFFLTV